MESVQTVPRRIINRSGGNRDRVLSSVPIKDSRFSVRLRQGIGDSRVLLSCAVLPADVGVLSSVRDAINLAIYQLEREDAEQWEA